MLAPYFRWFLGILFTSSMCAACATVNPPGEIVFLPEASFPPAVQRAAKSVYRLSAYDACNFISKSVALTHGSAVVFSDRAITANHVLTDAHKYRRGSGCISMKLLSQDATNFVEAKTSSLRFFRDIAFLQLIDFHARESACFSLQYAPGDSVYAIGYPGVNNFSRTIVPGVIIDDVLGDYEPYGIMFGDKLAYPGMSGGALVNREGCVIGIIIWVGVDRMTVLPINIATNFLDIEEWIR